MSRNRQHGHVGNLGDVTKHAALVELAAMLAERFASVSFVDTHTFLLHAPLANAELWRREADSRLAKQPAYARYVELERAYLQRTGEYRCSSGLVLDVLGEQLACAVLGEANGLTRAELKGQLAKEQHTRVHVVDEARAVDREARVPSAGALLVHVDPFTLTPEAWAPLAPALDSLSARAAAAVFVLYSFTPRRPHRVALASNRHELRRRAPRRPPRGRAVRVGGCGGGRARHRCLARLA